MKRGQGTREKVIQARVAGKKTVEAAKIAGITRRQAEKILAKPEVQSEIAQRFANAQEARSYCHRRLYERIAGVIDDDSAWRDGMDLFNKQSDSDARVMATLQPVPAQPGFNIQVNQQTNAVTLDELVSPHRPAAEEV